MPKRRLRLRARSRPAVLRYYGLLLDLSESCLGSRNVPHASGLLTGYVLPGAPLITVTPLCTIYTLLSCLCLFLSLACLPRRLFQHFEVSSPDVLQSRLQDERLACHDAHQRVL